MNFMVQVCTFMLVSLRTDEQYFPPECKISTIILKTLGIIKIDEAHNIFKSHLS